MSEATKSSDAASTRTDAASVELFDPPMCCSSGICGPNVDQALVDVNEMIRRLKAEGIKVERYQMRSHRAAFLNNADVMQLVRERQMAALPITVAQGRVIKVGAYPTVAEVKAALDKGA